MGHPNQRDWQLVRPEERVYVRGRGPSCTICGTTPVKARGWCSKHYNRWYWHRDVHRCIRRANGEGTIDRQGYVRVTVPPDTPNAFVYTDGSDGRNRRKAWIHEHRLVMVRSLGRPLYPDETVHHKNGVRRDNRIENLELWSSNHPSGQRVDDLVAWAEEVLGRYGG